MFEYVLTLVACGVLVAASELRNRRLAIRLYLAEHVIDKDRDARADYEDALRHQGVQR